MIMRRILASDVLTLFKLLLLHGNDRLGGFEASAAGPRPASGPGTALRVRLAAPGISDSDETAAPAAGRRGHARWPDFKLARDSDLE